MRNILQLVWTTWNGTWNMSRFLVNTAEMGQGKWVSTTIHCCCSSDQYQQVFNTTLTCHRFVSNIQLETSLQLEIWRSKDDGIELRIDNWIEWWKCYELVFAYCFVLLDHCVTVTTWREIEVRWQEPKDGWWLGILIVKNKISHQRIAAVI